MWIFLVELQPSCRCGVEGIPLGNPVRRNARVIGGQPVDEVSVKNQKGIKITESIFYFIFRF